MNEWLAWLTNERFMNDWIVLRMNEVSNDWELHKVSTLLYLRDGNIAEITILKQQGCSKERPICADYYYF